MKLLGTIVIDTTSRLKPPEDAIHLVVIHPLSGKSCQFVDEILCPGAFQAIDVPLLAHRRERIGSNDFVSFADRLVEATSVASQLLGGLLLNRKRTVNRRFRLTVGFAC